MIADGVLARFPALDRCGFCVGNIAPDCGYFTEILPLKTFPDYIDYLPKGCIVCKIGVMGYHPKSDQSILSFIPISQVEYAEFVEDTIQLVVNQFVDHHLL